MKRWTRFICSVCLLVAVRQAAAADEIDVVSFNQYLGADLTPVLNAPDPVAFNDGLVEVLVRTAAANTVERVREQAELIAKRGAEIVGLQEVWSLQCVDFYPPEWEIGCHDPAIARAFVDQLQLTREALDELGADYRVAAIAENLDLSAITVPGMPFPGLPFNINGADAFLIALDRDVILSRRDVAVSKVVLCGTPSADGCNYQTLASVAVLGVEIPIRRSFVIVDAAVRERVYRIVNTHLEVKGEDVGDPAFTFFQAAQAYELLGTLALTTPADASLIVLGDMNSSPDQADIPGLFPQPFEDGVVTPYHQFVEGGFYDVWALRPGALTGYSCCQAEDLLNRHSLLTERIDMIFSGDEPAKVKQVRILGAKVSAKTSPAGLGLWPSDHGGIAALVQF